MKCSRCGNELVNGASFCNHCGAHVNVNNYVPNNYMSMNQMAAPKKKSPAKTILVIALVISLSVSGAVCGVFASGSLFNKKSVEAATRTETTTEKQTEETTTETYTNTDWDTDSNTSEDTEYTEDYSSLSNATVSVSNDENVFEVKDWIKEINPNYDPYDEDESWEVNCGSCAYSVYQRFEGDDDIHATSTNIGTIEGMEAKTGMHAVRNLTSDEIEQKLLEAGNGAHTIVGIFYRDVDMGHWFNIININGSIVYVDGQNGKVYEDGTPDYGAIKEWFLMVN